jgi:Transposase IS66 family
VSLLLDKYLFYRPTHRLLADWATHGLDLSPGTVTDGLKHLVGLFEPVYQALVCRSQAQPLWHADETRWLVFAGIEGKVGYRWYLWVFHSAEVVVFVLAAGRSREVPEEHFGPVEGRGIVVVDRYKAHQAIDKVKSGRIVLAFCWAHVRRRPKSRDRRNFRRRKSYVSGRRRVPPRDDEAALREARRGDDQRRRDGPSSRGFVE